MITLTLRGQVWTARYSGTDSDSDMVRDLFGTDEIPTPYTDRSDPELVRRAIAGRNPTHVVVLSDALAAYQLRRPRS
jgi:hypothetical protein